MAPPRLFLLSVSIVLVFTQARADASVGGEEAVVAPSDDSDSLSSLKIHLEKLNSKIHALESLLDERTKELISRDDVISKKEKTIQEKLGIIASLQSEVASLQNKGAKTAQELVGKAHARVSELEIQVEKLKKEVETKHGEKVELEVRVSKAEEKRHGLHSDLKKLQNINDEQKVKIHKTERALRIAEEELMKAKFEAISKTKELLEVHGAWLPPWLPVHFLRCQSYLEAEWNEHGKPVLDAAAQKALEKKAQAEKWAEPHMETLNKKWIPAAKQRWVAATADVKPYLQSSSAKTIELFETCRSTITPRIKKAREVADPYLQEAKKFSKPYIDQVAIVTKPHVDRVRVLLKPHTKRVVRTYGKFLKSATMYHYQVQDAVRGMLKKHVVTRALATKEFVWFAASALLALPVILLLRIGSAMFGKKPKKPTKSSGHARRRKRIHADNKAIRDD